MHDKVSFGILFLVTFLVPIFFVPMSSVSTQLGTSLLFAFGVILAVIVYIISGLYFGSLDLPKPARYILGSMIVVPIVYALAGVAYGFSRLAFFGYTFDISTVGFIILGFSYMFLVSILFRSKQQFLYSYFAFLVSAVLVAVFVLIRLFYGAKALSFGFFPDITSTTIGSWNNVGIFFGAGAILSLLTYEMLAVSKLMKLLASIALLLSLFFLALINFSIIWTILSACTFLFILYKVSIFRHPHVEKTSVLRRLTSIPLYTAIVFIISIIFVFWGSTVLSNKSTLGGYLSDVFKISNVEVRPTLAVTLDIARNTIAQKPLFGSGPNTFSTQWLTWKPDDVVSTIFWNTDFTNGIGLIPTFAVTTGLAGILSWLLFLGFYLYLGLKSLFIKTGDHFVKYLLTSSFFISLYLWIMAFAYVPSVVIFILTFFFTGLFFASVYLSGLIQVETETFIETPRKGFVYSLVLVACLVVGVSIAYGLFKSSESLWYFQKSSYAINSQNDFSLAEDYMAKAITLVPNDVYFRAFSEIELAKLNKLLSSDPAKIKPEEAQKQFIDIRDSAIKAGLAAQVAGPSNYLNWVALGQVYAALSVPELKVQNAYESAQFAFGKAQELNPKNPGIFLLLSRLAVTNKNLKQAKSYALQAINLKRNYLDAYFLLSQIEVSDNNIKGAIDSVTAASIINPTDPGIFFQLGLLKYNSKDFAGAILSLEKATTMTPDYANAKYFLGLSYEAVGEHDKAIAEFSQLKVTNPDSKEVDAMLTALTSGKPIFGNTKDIKPEKGKTLPIKEKQ